MKSILKRLGTGLLAVAMLCTTVATTLPEAQAATTTTTQIIMTIDSPSFTVDGIAEAIDAEGSAPTITEDGYTILPLRGVVEAMGGTLTWSEATQQVTINLGDQTALLTINATVAYIDGVASTMSTQPTIVNGRTLVHIRALEMFDGVSVSWDATTRQVTVDYDQSSPITINLINNTGSTITSLYYSDSLATSDSFSENMLSGSLTDGKTTSFEVNLPSTGVISVYAEKSDGFKTYSGLNLNTAVSYATVILNSSDMEYAVDAVIEVPEGVDVTFYNKMSVDIEELYIGTSSSASTLKSGDDILDGDTLDAGDDVTIGDIDLSTSTYWYFLAIDEDDEEYKTKITLADNDADEFTIKISSSGVFSEYDPDAAGDLTVGILNMSNTKIYAIFVVDEDDAADWDDYVDDLVDDADDDDEDVDDIDELIDYNEDYYLEDSTIKAGSIAAWDTFDAETYDLIIYLDDGLDEYIYLEGIDLEDADESAIIIIGDGLDDVDEDDYESKWSATWSSSTSNYTVYTDDDDYVVLAFENDFGDELGDITLRDNDSDQVSLVTDLDDGYWSYAIIDVDYYDDQDDFRFYFYEEDKYLTDDDDYINYDTISDFWDDYSLFVYITLTDDDDDVEVDSVETLDDFLV